MSEQNPFDQPPQTLPEQGMAPTAEIIRAPEIEPRLQDSADFAGSAALSSEVDMPPASRLGVTDGQFRVVRSNGEVEDGWTVRSALWKDKNGSFKVTIEKPDSDVEGGVLVKDIAVKTFLDWQDTENDNPSVSEKKWNESTETPASERALIDKVPSSNDLKNAENEKLIKQEKAKEAQIAQAEAEFEEFRSQFTEDQTLNMWKYASGLMRKADAQQRGDGQGSMIEGQNASEGLNNLKTPELRTAAQTYHRHMVNIQNAINR